MLPVYTCKVEIQLVICFEEDEDLVTRAILLKRYSIKTEYLQACKKNVGVVALTLGSYWCNARARRERLHE